MPKYDIDKELGKIKRKRGIHEKITDRPTTSKEFKRRLAGMATEAQQNAFRKKYPEFGPPKSKETIRQNRQSILRNIRATHAKDNPAGRRRLSNLLGENTGMGFTPKTIRPKKKRGGTASRKGGGKIMVGYKAGGKV